MNIRGSNNNIRAIGSILAKSSQLVENTGSSLFPIQDLEELDSNITFLSFMLNLMELHIVIAEGLQDCKEGLQDVLKMFNAKKKKRLSQTLINLSLESNLLKITSLDYQSVGRIRDILAYLVEHPILSLSTTKNNASCQVEQLHEAILRYIQSMANVTKKGVELAREKITKRALKI